MMWAFSSLDAAQARHAREQFVNALKLRGPRDADYSACEAIFGELISNVARHAPGPIRIVLDWNDDEAQLRVEDRGRLFDFVPGLPANPMAESGRGLYIVTALAQNVDIEPIPGDGKAITVLLPVRTRAA